MKIYYVSYNKNTANKNSRVKTTKKKLMLVSNCVIFWQEKVKVH